MWKAMLAGTTALTIAGASLLYAQQIPPAQSGRDSTQQRPRLSAEDRAALLDARIAGLKAGLKLTPAQEKNWPAVESALRERAKLRTERFEQMRKLREQSDASQRERDIIERMRTRADAMTTEGATLKRLAEAVDPLYKSLDEGQKQRFALLYRMGGERPHFFRGRGMDHNMGPDRQMGPEPQGPRQGPGPRQRRTENEL
jgi:zinc resistance-associated protein